MPIRSISEVFRDLRTGLTADRVSVDEILEGVHERGFGFLLLFFSFPLAIPVPKPPGTSTIFAIPLLLLTVQQMLGFHKIWLPAFIRQKTLPTAFLISLFDTTIPWLQRVEKLTKPRMGFITQGVCSHLMGFLGVFMSLCIAIPFPMTNTVPGFGLALMAVGIIMRDGLAVLIGAVIGTSWALMLLFIALFLGTEGIDMLTEGFKSLFA